MLLRHSLQEVHNLIAVAFRGQDNLNGTLGRELLPGADVDDAALRDYVLCGPPQFRPQGVACDSDGRVVSHLAGLPCSLAFHPLPGPVA